jgi:GntR family transcriptional regulator
MTARAHDHRPRHQQIAAELRDLIMRGELGPGTQLPSTAQLVERYGAANATIQHALKALKDEGFLDSRVGKGVYVRDRQPFGIDAAAYLAPTPGRFRYRLLTVETVVPPADIAEGLRRARRPSSAPESSSTTSSPWSCPRRTTQPRSPRAAVWPNR